MWITVTASYSSAIRKKQLIWIHFQSPWNLPGGVWMSRRLSSARATRRTRTRWRLNCNSSLCLWTSEAFHGKRFPFVCPLSSDMQTASYPPHVEKSCFLGGRRFKGPNVMSFLTVTKTTPNPEGLIQLITLTRLNNSNLKQFSFVPWTAVAAQVLNTQELLDRRRWQRKYCDQNWQFHAVCIHLGHFITKCLEL